MKHNLCFSWRQRAQHKEVIFLILWAGWVFLFFSGSRYKDIPYILPMFPPLAILIARYLAAAWDRRYFSGVQLGCWILFITILLSAVAGLGAPQHYLERYSNWPVLEVPSEEGRLVSTHQKEYPDLPGLAPYIYAQTGVLLVGALAMLILAKRRGFPLAFLSLTLTWALYLLVMNSSLSVLDQRRSVKDLAGVLRSRLQPTDEVASYHTYYQDLPVYLQRRILIVGWKGELQFGVQVDGNYSSWVIDEAVFWRRWHGPAVVYMLTDRTTAERLRSRSDHKFYLVAQTNYDILLSNKATASNS